MMLHETTIDIKHEQQFADKLQVLWNCKLTKLRELSRVDFVIIQGGRASGFVEYKCRSFESTKYDTALLSLDKWLYLNVLSEATRLPVYLFVSYTDADTFIQIDKSIQIEVALRDGAPVVLIPVEQFERI